MELTEKQKREADFFDKEYTERYKHFSESQLDKNLIINLNEKFNEYPERYIHAYELVGNINGLNVLDLGCGTGESSVILAKKGAIVNAFDISNKAVGIAKRRAEINNVLDKIKFEVNSVENMKYDSNIFDVVFGIGLLHHINISVAAPTIYNVLKHGGHAVFIEPIVFSSFLDKIRHLSLVTHFVPDEGEEVLITEDEHQITTEEFNILVRTFKTANYKAFRLLSRLDRIICGYPVNEKNKLVRILNMLDRFLLKKFLFLQKYGGWGVIHLSK